MLDTIRDAPLGQALRWVTGNRVLLYPDELEGFEPPKLVSDVPSRP
jgi:MFS transporter, DHA1 family, multidrug resistance protein